MGSDPLNYSNAFSHFPIGNLVKEQGPLCLVELAHTCVDTGEASSLGDQIEILHASKVS